MELHNVILTTEDFTKDKNGGIYQKFTIEGAGKNVYNTSPATRHIQGVKYFSSEEEHTQFMLDIDNYTLRKTPLNLYGGFVENVREGKSFLQYRIDSYDLDIYNEIY